MNKFFKKILISAFVIFTTVNMTYAAYYKLYDPKTNQTYRVNIMTLGGSNKNEFNFAFFGGGLPGFCSFDVPVESKKNGLQEGKCLKIGNSTPLFWSEISPNTFYNEIQTIIEERKEEGLHYKKDLYKENVELKNHFCTDIQNSQSKNIVFDKAKELYNQLQLDKNNINNEKNLLLEKQKSGVIKDPYITYPVIGIGTEISGENGKLLIINIRDNSPAKKAGLKVNDEILQINDSSSKNMTVFQASNKMRGEEGTVVILLINRKGEKNKIYSLRREKFYITKTINQYCEFLSMKSNAISDLSIKLNNIITTYENLNTLFHKKLLTENELIQGQKNFQKKIDEIQKSRDYYNFEYIKFWLLTIYSEKNTP